jgi:acyl carrier protein
LKATNQWPDFVAEVARVAEVSPDTIDRHTLVIRDLDLDSLSIVELVVALDHAHGIDVAGKMQAEGWSQVTIGELFDRLFGGPTSST